jgi:hypothetical protein
VVQPFEAATQAESLHHNTLRPDRGADGAFVAVFLEGEAGLLTEALHF